ncbi:HNH endonuclease [Mycobacterium paraterrae]|uniref:HNH endonuclease n=1 Tax=Mycobacterium paraterrae TaxID=577492 RepID=A0ABY3VH96_9MYCO|nr:HNH endonuclease [Mycobacterium paraterrae]UMB68787.2 HNH endonuclease [Mycobacterium paraterrae]
MHIGFRTSGGRGEYEVVGNHSGFNALGLEGWTFNMRWPDGIVRDTGLWLDPAESGKPRLRSMLDSPIQISRIVAPMLLLPDPTRAFRNTPNTLPIIRAKDYTITDVGFGTESEFSGVADLVTFDPSFITVANQGHSDDIGVAARWSRIEAVYDQAALLPSGLPALVTNHKNFIASGDAVGRQLTTTVNNVINALAASPGSSYQVGLDPLPALEGLLRIAPPSGPTLPPPDELGEDAPEVSVRSAHQYRLAKVRGAAGRRFSAEVRAAYRNRCAFCGAQLGGIDGIRSGIDAAHILAWSQHDLDVVENGIALCKLHHWAFDAGVLAIRKEGDSYYLRFTTLADLIDQQSKSRIAVEGTAVPADWLPEDPQLHPSVNYLTRLYADLGVTFSSDV